MIARWGLYQERPQGLSRMAIFIAYGLIGLATIFYAADPSRAVDTLSNFVKDIIVVLVIISLTRSGETLRQIIWTMLAAGIFMGTISVFQQLTGTFGQSLLGLCPIFHSEHCWSDG